MKRSIKIKWGLLGAGGIAHVFANAIRSSHTGEIMAIASRSIEKAEALAKKFNIKIAYGSYDNLLADESVDAVYISVINPMHAELAIKAARAGKHILVEKPIAMNLPEATSMIAAAKENDVFLMEAFMYRCHPQTSKLVDLIQNGIIGDIRVIRSSFGYNATEKSFPRVYKQELGGGSILDVGTYPLSMARLLAGAARGAPFDEPEEFKGIGVPGENGLDRLATAIAKFKNGIIAELTCAVNCSLPCSLTIHGEHGVLQIDNPWLPSSPARFADEVVTYGKTPIPCGTIILERYGEERKLIEIPADRDLYAYEADLVAEYIDKR